MSAAPQPTVLATVREGLPEEVARRITSAADLLRRRGAGSADAHLPTGVLPFDLLLDGGLPRGRLVEVSGPSSGRDGGSSGSSGRSGSTGRFALVLAALAAATSRGESAALVDRGDHLDPQRAEEAGCDLARLLWIRPRRAKDALLAAEIAVDAGFRLVVLDLGSTPLPRRLTGTAATPWIRLARASSARDTALLVSTLFPVAGPAAAAALRTGRGRPLFRASGATPFLAGLSTSLLLERNRHARGGRTAPLALAFLPGLPVLPEAARPVAPTLAPTAAPRSPRPLRRAAHA